MVNFTEDWFTQNIPNLEKHLTFKVNKALEIGSYEGRSSCWFLEHEQFKDVEMYFIDIWKDEELYETFKTNITQTQKFAQDIHIVRAYSDDALQKLSKHQDSFDFIYIDGDHHSEQAYKDGCNSFKLLKSGGLMVFDDYLIDYTLVPQYAHYGTPKEGVNQFLNEHSELLDIVLFDYQVGIIKK